MTKQTIAELTNFFQQFKVAGDKTLVQSNLLYDDAVDYFFRNMVERGLADATMKFYRNKLGAFRKFLVQIKKVQCLELVTEEEIKYYFNTKYSKKKTVYYNCHARALRAFFNYLEKDGYLIASPAHNIKPEVFYRVLALKAKKLFGDDVRMNPHKFRHTFATHLVINGGDAFSLRDLLGHTNIETTKIYVDMSPKDLKTKHAEHSLISNMQKDEQ